ncbi:calcium-binding protein [Paracoccus sp. WLY502]|uniref:calcium-binding protein n=1 Tax=Paracoccus yibinensis TaxID=3068891 RepID=UPI00279688DB|nr:calcium-binding protein [Paracoccus sp. WLY502]MDQ1902398.1 calcium-binding protein [Paracoccus sp. WLY502]
MVVRKKAVYLTDGKSVTVQASDTWTNLYDGTEIINISGHGVVNIYGDIIAGYRSLGSHTAISVNNYFGDKEVRINIFSDSEVLNKNPYGYGMYFDGRGHLSNSGTIQELFILGGSDGAARLSNKGLIYSEGPWAVGTNTSHSTIIDNSGEIRGKLGVAVLGREFGAGETTITNQGQILGSDIGVKITFEMGARADVEISNSGTIRGGWKSIVSENQTAEFLRNTGVLIGDVVLGGGNDTLDNRGGRIKGEALLGSGADMALPGASIETYIGGGGIDTLDFRTGGGLRVSLLTGDGTGRAQGDRYIGFERILGSETGADTLTGDGFANILEGFGGNDILSGGAGKDRLIGGSGNDTYIIDSVDIIVEADGQGTDILRAAHSLTLVENVENLVLLGKANLNGTGNALNNRIAGNTGHNVLSGLDGHDTLLGGIGNDRLTGGLGSDRLVGGVGADILTGGAERDVFVFVAPVDSRGALRDRITDFTSGMDDIDLRQIDSDGTVAGNQAFAFGGSRAAAHSIWFTHANGNTLVCGDVNGDKVTDFEIVVNGLSSLTASDFLL